MQAEKAWKFYLEHSKDKFLLGENLTQNVVKMLFKSSRYRNDINSVTNHKSGLYIYL